MLVVQGIAFSYGHRDVLKGINLEVKSGEVVSILGINGSGKSTLLRTINRILKPRLGTVFIEGRDIADMNRNDIAANIGYMPQKSNGVFCTVFDAVLLGRKPYIKWNVQQKDIEIASRILRLMGIEGYAMRYTNELSGGELQKVIIARALAQEPKVLLLDEPINHLDIKNQLEVMGMIRDITLRLNIATVIVMHDINTALRYSDKFIMIKNGVIYASGGREIINDKNIKEVFNIEAILSEIDGIPLIVPHLSVSKNI
ncbi:MAG: ABC transporter ATP-binding protein [Thermodesulfovibrionales bacterium]